MPTVAELIEYYVNLLIVQYNQQPNFRAMMGSLINQTIANNLTFDVRDGFDLDTAVGVQLDIVGKYIGVDRFFKGQVIDGVNFAFLVYTDLTPSANQTGFTDYTNFDTNVDHWLNYGDVVSTNQSLNDTDYRVLLKLKILQNNSNHSHGEIDDGLFDFFGTSIRASSNGNMRMDYFVPSQTTALIEVAIEKDVLPRPMAVAIGYLIQEDEGFFGFATYGGTPAFVKGFSDYTDFDTKAGEMITYDKLMEA